MADKKEYITGDPSDVLNVYKALQSVNIELRKGVSSAGTFKNVYSHLLTELKDMEKHQKALILMNMNIEITTNRIKLLEEAKFNKIRAQKILTTEINKERGKLQILLKTQAFIENEINEQQAANADKLKSHIALEKAITEIQFESLKSLFSIKEVWDKTSSKTLVVLEIFKQIVDIFDALDTAAKDFRMDMGFTRDATGDIDANARAGAISMAKMGVTGKDMYESFSGLSKALFSSKNVSSEMANNVALLSRQLGVSAEDSSELLKNLGMASRATASSQQDAMLFATALSEAAGTPLKDVMKDINAATTSMYQYTSRSGVAMIKAAVDARRMGTTIESSVKSSASLLNFTQNVRDEMEASVLVGKSINLQRARELAYHRDLKGLNTEILKIMKDVNFEQLDPFQQDAVARALGKSAAELGQMAQASRERESILRNLKGPEKEQYLAAEKMLAASSKTAKIDADAAKRKLMEISNQTRLNSITNSWHAIMMKLSEKFLPVIDKTLKFVADHLDDIVSLSAAVFGWWRVGGGFIKNIVAELKLTKTKMGKIATIIKDIGTSLKLVAMWFIKIGQSALDFGKSITSWFKGGKITTFLSLVIKQSVVFFKAILRIFGLASKSGPFTATILKMAGFFGRWLNPIGWIITGIMFVISLFNRLNGIGEAFKKGVLQGIWFGIKAIGLSLYDTLLKPFVDVFKWVWDHLCGKSPSMIGLGMIKGLKAIARTLIDTLLFPYKMAWSLIKKIPFVSHLLGGKNVGAEVGPAGAATMQVERATANVGAKKGGLSATVDGMSDELSKKMDGVIAAINALRDDMKAGTLTANVYIDSQKLDALMGRRLAYTGNLV